MRTAMVEFALRPRISKFCVALSALHGLTDFRRPAQLWPYAALAVPFPGWLVTPCFLLASLRHFADDLGPGGSLALHTLFAATARAHGLDRAFDAALAYLSCAHVPMHFYRVAKDGGLASVALSACAAAALRERVPSVLLVNHGAQKVVIAHVASGLVS